MSPGSGGPSTTPGKSLRPVSIACGRKVIKGQMQAYSA